MSTHLRLRAWPVRLLLLLATALLAAPTASATDISATLGQVAFTDQQVTAVLTVRGGPDGTKVDLATVGALVGGQGSVGAPTTSDVKVRRRTMLVIDTSGSMSAEAMAAVRSSVESFLASVPPDVEIGVVSFSDQAQVDVPLTTDHANVQSVVNGLSAHGETALYAAINLAVAQLGTEGERSIVLLSDGGESVNTSAGAQRSAVDALQGGGVRAEIVAFKTAETQNAVLDTFAAAGGGSVLKAEDPAAVAAGFKSAAAALRSQLSVQINPPAGMTGVQQVVVTGLAGGSPFAVSTKVDLGAGVPLPTPSASGSSSVRDIVIAARQPTGLSSFVPHTSIRWTVALSIAGIFLAAMLMGLAFASPAAQSERSRREELINYFTRGAPRTVAAQARAQANPSAVSQNLVAIGGRVMEGRASTSRTLQLIERADLPWRAGEWFVLRCVSVLVGIALCMLFLPLNRFLDALLGAALGYVLPAVLLRVLASRRANKFEELLPDVLMLIATSLASGFSLPQSLDAVARDSAEPAAREFSRALAETRIGTDLSDSLSRMAARMDSENLRWAIMAIRIQREVGGNLGETLRTTAKTLRERQSLRRQVRALSAEGRLSAYILIALPIGILVYSYFVNHDYVALLWTHPLGIMMSIAGIISLIVGVFWMRKVVDIDV